MKSIIASGDDRPNNVYLEKQLIKAIKNNDIKKVKELIGLNEEIDEAYRRYLIPRAIDNGNKTMVELLLEGGINCDALELFDYAAFNNNTDIMKLLIEKGINIQAKNHNNETFLHRLICWADFKDIAELLIARGLEIEVRDQYGNTPLHYATEHNRKEIAKLLLDLNVDKNVDNNSFR